MSLAAAAVVACSDAFKPTTGPVWSHDWHLFLPGAAEGGGDLETILK
ncbi:MAG TPA: hypothetical protein VNJ06_13190 [Gemmatimonadales bacterium]|nr:hypothetical protein [Gemmatimonadales bacterium]